MEQNALGQRVRRHTVDIAVIGGGLSGMLAAIAAAREGCRVLLMQDRPVLGGNCSSEIRMWALGCHGKNNRETGILEEILLENMHRNPTRNFSIWDSILYEKVKQEKNITLLLNCTCQSLEMEANAIQTVTGWQLTTYTHHVVKADIFIDCSGDSVLAPMSGALYRMGRESCEEYGEDIAPPIADSKTMGMTCMIQARETDHPVRFIPPSWANVYETDADLHDRGHDLSDPIMNYWWMELGGEQDCIADAEEIRDELLAVAFGVWDHIKNRGEHGAENWELDWVGFLPGKRESIRYIGDYVMTQNDVRSEGRFDDLIAYGGWTMDDHNPGGIRYPGDPTIYHWAPAPFGIPYRCLYSKNIENLMFAGRNISVTHTAMSSSRVMATCAILGQAAGTAAAIAVKRGLLPRGVYEQAIPELQEELMENDCWLPFHRRTVPALTRQAVLTGKGTDIENLRNGLERPIGGEDNGAWLPIGEPVEYRLEGMRHITRIRLVLDSDLERESCDGHEKMRRYPMLCNRFLNETPFGFPKTMLKDFEIQLHTEDGEWKAICRIEGNIHRLVILPVDARADGVRLIPICTWAPLEDETYGKRVHLFAFDVR